MPTPDLDPRYPVGKFTRPETISKDEVIGAIATLADLPSELRNAVQGLSYAQLNLPYRDGGWSSRQVVHHLADSHMNAIIRLRLALTEDWPTIKTYDEAAWADLADSRRLPVEVSLNLIEALHGRWVRLLESLSEDDFRKGFEHPEMGRQNLASVLALYDWHSRHHTAHIVSLRARQGW